MERADDSVPIHQPTVEASPAILPEVDAATDVVVKVKVSCPEGCDLRGAPVTITAGDTVVTTSELATWDDKVNATNDLAFKTPETVGEFAWSIVFARHESAGCIHEESALPISLTTKPHTTSMSVWGVPSPVVMNSSFMVNVGVKCSVLCQLTGRIVEIRNEAGAKVGEGYLAETPWPGTDSLYWTAVQVTAPSEEGVLSWTVGFPAIGMGPPHEETSATFSFRTARPPQAAVTIEIIAKSTGLPIEDVEVRLGAYEAFTDERGAATVAVPHGTYALDIRKDGYKAPPITVEVSKDVTVQVGAVTAPTKAEIEEMMKRFEGETWR